MFSTLSNTSYSFPKRQTLDASKLKEFADNNFKLMEILDSSKLKDCRQQL